MKLDVIRDNLSLCEQALEDGQFGSAAEHAYNTIRLLMQRTTEWSAQSQEDLRKNYIALVGVAGAVQTQLEALAEKRDPASLPEKLRQRISQIQAELKTAEAEYQMLKELNKELLSQEPALRKEKDELEALQKKLSELVQLKEKELVARQKKVKTLNAKLDQLEKECTALEKLYALVKNELEENLALLAALPETTGVDTLDALIAQGRQHKKTLEEARDSSGEPLRRIIEQVRQLEQMTRGTLS